MTDVTILVREAESGELVVEVQNFFETQEIHTVEPPFNIDVESLISSPDENAASVQLHSSADVTINDV